MLYKIYTILYNFWYELLMLTKNIKWNDMVHSAYCFIQVFHSHNICQEFVKKWTDKIVSNSLLLWEFTCCYNRLWEFSVTKPICYKDVFVRSFVLLHLNSRTLWLWNLSFDLLFKCLLNLKLIPSSQGEMIMENVKIQCIVFGHLWTLPTS